MKGRKISLEILSKYRNVLMGLQTILIIVFHYTEDCKIYNVKQDGIIYLFYKYIGSSGVDIFLFLSGISLFFSLQKDFNIRKFYQKRLERILIPYFSIAVIAWWIVDIGFEHLGYTQYIKDIFFVSFFTDGVRWYWYVFAIVLCYLMYPYLFKLIQTGRDKYLVIVCLGIGVLILTKLLQVYSPETFGNLRIMLLRIPTFFAGCLFGRMVYEKQKIPRWLLIFIITSSVILAWPLQLVKNIMWDYFVRAMVNLSFCIIFLACAETIKEKETTDIYNFFKKIFEWFGKYSFEIYLVHVTVRKIMTLCGFYTYRLKYELIMVMVSIIISILLKKVTDKMNKRVVKNKI